MAILKLRPSCKDYLWGGQKLITDFHKKYEGKVLAETWELSCHKDGASYIADGEYAEKSLEEYILMRGKKVLGEYAEKFRQFPILIKFIDAAQDLSIQVHPDDKFALENEQQYGKTEMWYVVDCEPGASLYYGFSREVGLDELRERIQNHTLPEVLNKVYVKKGDTFFIEPGTIHAIGKGCVIAEIQQNSNVTYRVYDYGRKDKDGHERELHIEKALRVTKRIPERRQKSFAPHIASCGYFTVDKLVLDGKLMKKIEGTVDSSTFVNLLVLDGAGMVTAEKEQSAFRKGDSLLVTAGTGKYTLEGSCEILVTTL
ncbi:type I phosphomannose isomerase catalytic subunit [Mediterraneibacter gnavus]|uniref:type I phosphomannose isomerase catalytic subunit n=1 Tax=Mediterraneibacter gnavus TaxID=33038 RepID=UPI00232F9D5C|nr:type I phosphomannose isomerase catalytic subunit [Mediterraneibacter gnavus]MDB8711096.1 class I mannose-6-phosphate isomerase [Mediterraneibacter gnavus]MDB8714464.1 class I mannose-6-phosphate isomerase [Mediterraneibacter gnavus]